jgi:ribosomal protein S18 acetylase RimI-like enzyme
MAGHPLQFPKFIINQYPQRWRSFLQNASRCAYFVACTDTGEPIGHAGYIFNEEVGLYEIVGVAVSNSFQRRGIGKALIHTICTNLREIGSVQIILYTLGHVGNEDTLTFYRNIGFELFNYETNFFRADYHRVTFIKSIE